MQRNIEKSTMIWSLNRIIITNHVSNCKTKIIHFSLVQHHTIKRAEILFISPQKFLGITGIPLPSMVQYSINRFGWGYGVLPFATIFFTRTEIYAIIFIGIECNTPTLRKRGFHAMLQGKTVLLGVTGGIAAFKAAALASALVKQHCNVEVILTEHATRFITPLTFEQLTGNRAMVDTFDRNFSHQVEHIALAHRTDLVLVAPATANVCAKLAHGIADDMLTTTILACKGPKLLAPAMNTNMYENPVTQDNLDALRHYGWEVIAPASGRLACGDVGAGKMPEPDILLQHVLRQLALPHDLVGKKVLVTAGPTQESLDPVRYLTNHSSGKMGYALARMAMLRGGEVTLISGPTALTPPPFVHVIPVVSAQDMFEAVAARCEQADFIFKAAAVADYTPSDYSDDKMKKKDGELSIPMKRTQDILQYLGHHRRAGQIICGFSMETQNMLENSRAKLNKKRVDLICANNLKVAGSGFGVDTNIITLITADHVEELPLLSKEDTANRILDAALRMTDS